MANPETRIKHRTSGGLVGLKPAKPGEGFQPGNTHGGAGQKERAKLGTQLRLACERDDWKMVRKGLNRVLEKFSEADPWAVEFVRDTLDGKPKMQIDATDAGGRSVTFAIVNYAEKEGPSAQQPTRIGTTIDAIPTLAGNTVELSAATVSDSDTEGARLGH